ncbi:MAG: CvpA family protein [Bacteroidales bacterium]|jgi:membrane protein required for colicin V production|nr:CvpA family protein [Bacteroidales bacterium]MDD3272596.1 CvpA family protein [Bacteroidales bacterium]MDD4057419.1 CvpA family protein [Bacteroidales bacterium]
MSLNTVDVIILICLIPALFAGFMKGFVRQAAAVMALILGIWAGYHFSDFVSSKLINWINVEQNLLNIISFAIIFIGVLLLVNLAGKAVESLVKLVLLGWLDKLMGIIFALIKYAFILSVLVYLLESLDELFQFLPKETIDDSLLYGYLSKIAPAIFPYLKNLVSAI